ncbi:HD domain-containing protein [Sporobacter termitidis DSM 10068]|uniref:HD domain-containing protein n=1 Tax=Sporobacter termitidis DSM 10068 TaxID=1123282 RepID=A0A1M5UVV0_9FIRM|nr:HD domain-containing protein [Sporobacter termitidis]SHH67030.1 HD domain-containing protein [Sporobacter termitidis DSM 10068]
MQRVNRLLRDPEFIGYMQKNKDAEKDRVYCRHDLAHALDVARVGCILKLEEKLEIGKALIYAAALLHDIGRWVQYESGVGHDTAGAALAEGLLQKHGFSADETKDILEAIGGHRSGGGNTPLGRILYRADKLSRNCVGCDAIKTCKRFLNGEEPFLQY